MQRPSWYQRPLLWPKTTHAYWWLELRSGAATSKLDINFEDRAAFANVTGEGLQRSKSFADDMHSEELHGNLWDKQFGNRFFFWMQLTAGMALCSTLDQSVEKIFGAPYCRDTISGSPVSPGCRTYLRSRPAGGHNTAWNSFGAYEPAVAMVREEWARAAYHVLADEKDVDAQPCPHIPALPAGVSYLAVYFRCGDFVDNTKHAFIDSGWLKRFVPVVSAAAGAEFTVLFGNRRVHAGRGADVCTGMFATLERLLVNMTRGMTLLVAPEGYDDDPRVGVVRDLRCMSQSSVLVDYSLGSSFGWVASLLHNGCAAVVPHAAFAAAHSAGERSAMNRPGTARTRLVGILPGDLVKHIGRR